MKLGRREFLFGTTAALIASQSKIFSQKKKRRVVVAGAGLAGLSAAYQLAKRGFDVTVVEGRRRVGGRVFTLRDGFVDNQYAELGGELIGDGYKRLIAYIKEFRIPYEDVPEQFETSGSVASLQGGTGTTAILKDTLYPIGSQLEPHPYGLQGDEAKGLPPLLVSRNLRQMMRELQTNPLKINDFDKQSLADALRARGVSDAAIKLADISLNYNSIETVSAGGALLDGQKRMTAGSKPFRVVGGNYLIPAAFYEFTKKAGVKYIFGANIREIADDGSQVKVSFEESDGRIQSVEADKLICTIPFSVLREISFASPMPELKMKAIKEIGYTHITKVYLQGKRAEWDRRNIGTSIWTDTFLERIFENAGSRGEFRGIFTVWTEGKGAEYLESMNDLVRQKKVKEKFEEILPFMKGEIEHTATKSWTQDKFAKGCYAHYTVGQLTALKPHIKTPVGNIHFAGEHTAESAPGMEGALESAERVVNELIN